MEQGMMVRVLPPFDEAFPEVYEIDRIEVAEDGQQVVYLVDLESAFAPGNLEVQG